MKKRIILIILLGICTVFSIPHSFADLSDNLTASATVLPRTADYQFSLGQEYGLTNISQQTSYTYVITYGSEATAYFPTSDTVITLNWSNDLAPNNLHMFDYILGSASYGYGGAEPVIDVTNRTITWTIPSLPAGTMDQKLYVVLYSNTYDIPKQSFPVYLTATMSNQYLTMPVQTVQQTYTYKVPIPGPRPTPIPQQPTPTPTPTPEPSQVTSVAITNVSNSNATVRINTVGPSNITIDYGTSPKTLNQSVTSKGYFYPNTISLNNLIADTWYYFRITSTDLSGQYLSSELYSFKTATLPMTLNLDNDIIVFSANGQVLLSNLQSQSSASNPSIILPINNDFDLVYKVGNIIPLKSIDAVIISKVLGQNTFMASALTPELIIPMMEKNSSVYTATISPLDTGSYQIDVRLEDENGNIIEKKIADLRVIPHLTVYAQDTQKPLADARVYLYYLDPHTNRYLPLSPQLFGTVQNPNYTNTLGESMIVLPEGKYRVDESALLYDKESANFTLGPGSGQNFPVLYLKKDPFNGISLVIFMKDYLNDTWSKIVETAQLYSDSIRVFHLFAVAILCSFIILTFLLFLIRSHIHIKHFPVFLFFTLHKLFNKHTQLYLYGTITDTKKNPISHAIVEIQDADTLTILNQTLTNKAGRFYFKKTFDNSVSLLITKENFEPKQFTVGLNSMPNRGIEIHLEKGERHNKSFISTFIHQIEEMIGLLFEAGLVISLLLEILFLCLYGFEKTLPYFILSLFNLLLWFFYLRELSN